MEELREECRKTKEVRRAYRRFLLPVTSVRRCQIHACLKHSPLRTIPQLVISNSVFFPLPVPSLLLPVVFLLYVWVCRCGFVRNTILWLYIFLRFCAYIFVDLVKAVCSSLLVRCSAIEKTTIILFPFIFCLFIQPYIGCVDGKIQWSKCVGVVAWVVEQSELLCFCDGPSRGWEYLISRS